MEAGRKSGDGTVLETRGGKKKKRSQVEHIVVQRQKRWGLKRAHWTHPVTQAASGGGVEHNWNDGMHRTTVRRISLCRGECSEHLDWEAEKEKGGPYGDQLGSREVFKAKGHQSKRGFILKRKGRKWCGKQNRGEKQSSCEDGEGQDTEGL